MSRSVSSASSKGPVQYAFVRPNNKKTAVPKKILIPKTLNSLKRAIQKAFGEEYLPRSLQNEIGETIADIRDVTAGVKLFAVFKKGGGTENSQQNSVVSLSESESVQSIEAQPVTLYKEINLDDASQSNSVISDMEHQSGVKSLFGVSPSKVINKRHVKKEEKHEEELLSQSLSYSDDGVDQHPHNDLEENSKDEISKDLLLDEENNEAEEENQPSSSQNVCIELIKSCIPAEDNDEVIMNAYEQLIPESKQMLDEIFVLEDEQKIRFFKEMTKILEEQDLNPDIHDLSAPELLLSKARNYISEHRATNPISSSYLFRSAIVGPQKSGKSTFLGIIAQQFLVDLIVSNSWKRTFVFVADLDKFMSGYQDIQSFYHNFIHHIFSLLMAQLPSMLQYLPKIEKAFHSITEFSSKIESLPLPRRLTQNLDCRKLSADLQNIGASLAAIWFDPSSLSQWITSLVMLPSILAKTFGFHDVVFLIDHFEACSVQMDPLYPFEDSQPLMFVNEFWKYAINCYPFIISTADEESLIDSLSVIDNTSVDLLSSIEFTSLFDIVEDFSYSDVELTIDFEDEKMVSLKLLSSSCGGIPIYVDQWVKINETLDILEGMEEGTDEYEESLCEMISETETLLFLIIHREQGDANDSIEDQRFGVYNIHRHKVSK